MEVYDMKCAACNYSFKEPQEDKTEKDGNEQFLKLINSFHFKDKDGNLEEAYVFVCPKCGTLRMEKW
jgi:DNA-directed RNA polymerase subunit M/transcription elongation factor TFIIS